jgi:ribose transport system substrate-binding protein
MSKISRSLGGRTVLCAAGLAALMAVDHAGAAAAKTYHIALSNSYIGNQWRVQMVNLTKAYARKYYADKVKLTVVNSGTDVQAQIAAIDDMISQGVDAILVDPASESALNPVLEQAAQRGIVVVDFDHAVTAPSAYKVGVDFVKFGAIMGQWMADTLKGKGDVIMASPASRVIRQNTKVPPASSPNIPASISSRRSTASGTTACPRRRS